MFTALFGPPRVQGSPNLIVERSPTNTSPVWVNISTSNSLAHIYDVLDAQGEFQVQEGSPEVLLPPHRSLSNHTRSPAGSQFEQARASLGQFDREHQWTLLDRVWSVQVLLATCLNLKSSQRRDGGQGVRILKVRLSSELSWELSSELLDARYKNSAFQPKW